MTNGATVAKSTTAGLVTNSSHVEAASDRLADVLVIDLMSANPLTVRPEETIRTVASTMEQKRISCLPVVEHGRLVGLITEADFVARVVAKGLCVDEPVKAAMTVQPLYVDVHASVLDVLTLMTRHRVAHMPVCRDGLLVGIVTQTDVIRHQIASSVFMVGDISRMQSSDEIADVIKQLPRLLCSLVLSGSSAFETGRVMSSITGAVTRRLLELAELQFGPAQLEWVWLACGSQGRQEQTGASDQDNCLILADTYDPAKHGDYFYKLATFVCDGLNQAGYVYCPGDMMATNPQWRQPVSVWRSYFDEWVSKPGPTAQMLASVMFDLRPIQGEVSLYEPLRDEVLANAQANSLFVAHMCSNSLTHRPPLNFLGRLKTEKEGEYRGRVDLKHGGVVPIVDIARLYALSTGTPVVNTMERLGCGVESSVLSPSGAQSLRDAHELITMIRLRHQVAQIQRGEKPDNYVDPQSLSAVERDRLRRALKSVKNIQAAMSNRVAVIAR